MNFEITPEAERRFNEAQRRTQEKDMTAKNEGISKKYNQIEAIEIGEYHIKTFYEAPIPKWNADFKVLHVCEFCFEFRNSPQTIAAHKKKCKHRFPQGNEIYRKENISVFEVDGRNAKEYCQNMCLVGMHFLKCKKLYDQVEEFLFYVVTRDDKFAGYFSKEKHHPETNVCCIVVLPCYQKQGFGRFLIDFSFHLTRQEGLVGSPEQPFSDMGRISYASYWRTAIFEWLHENMMNFTYLSEISKGTGIAEKDVINVFDSLDWFQKVENKIRLEINWTMIEDQWKRATNDKTRIRIDPTFLKWTPVDYNQVNDLGKRPVQLKSLKTESDENEENKNEE